LESEFTAILQKLVEERCKETLLNFVKCKAFLADYTRNEYKKESRLLLQALDVGVQKTIDSAENIVICKKQQIRLLHEDYGLDGTVAADIVDTLAFVLRGDDQKSKIEALLEKAEELIKNKQYDEAINNLSAAIEIEPKNISAYLKRGEA
jgi:tetratricopeptide (TPR) repeat protein